VLRSNGRRFSPRPIGYVERNNDDFYVSFRIRRWELGGSPVLLFPAPGFIVGLVPLRGGRTALMHPGKTYEQFIAKRSSRAIFLKVFGGVFL
jgi:hypothetical protein